jgi:uncharacterized protein (DUF1501 family)
MNHRRQFLKAASALGLTASASSITFASEQKPSPLTVMVYLKGGNDGYNALVPFTNARYQRMRPTLALKRDQLITISETQGFHASLAALMPSLKDGNLAVIQGIGQQEVTNQHYRDAETQFTGAAPDEFFTEGWATRAIKSFRGGGNDVGVINMLYPNEWIARRKVSETAFLTNAKAERAANTFALNTPRVLKTNFPADSFGNALKATVELAAANMAPPVVHICLNAEDGDHHHAFDTHWDQPKYHGATLERLAKGLAAFRAGMEEIGRWNDTVLFTYDEFGRSPKENEKQGTHHGWANVQFVMGGRIKGGLVGEAMPVVNVFQIDGPAPTIDYRALYTTIIEQHWGASANGVFQKRFKPLDIFKA